MKESSGRGCCMMKCWYGHGVLLVCDAVMYVQDKTTMLMLEGMLNYNNAIIVEGREVGM
jgi:hypothetical protein